MGWLNIGPHSDSGVKLSQGQRVYTATVIGIHGVQLYVIKLSTTTSPYCKATLLYYVQN